MRLEAQCKLFLFWDAMAVADVWGTVFKDTPDVDSYVAFPPAFQRVQFQLVQLIPVGKMMHSTDFAKERSLHEFEWLNVTDFVVIP